MAVVIVGGGGGDLVTAAVAVVVFCVWVYAVLQMFSKTSEKLMACRTRCSPLLCAFVCMICCYDSFYL